MKWEDQVIPVSREALAAEIDGSYSSEYSQDIISYPLLSLMSTLDTMGRPCYYLPFRKNRQFVGRATILEALEKKLFNDQCETVALVGLGGIGKTQVALQFAYSVMAGKQEYSIFWVAALSESSFEKAYTELARELGIKKSKEEEDIKDLVRRHLSEKAGKWLLIVDNADDIDVVVESDKTHGIYRFLPESESGRVVFTTRSREVAVAVARNHIINLQEMNQEDATAFMETSLTQKELLQDKATTIELLQELTYLPLAIAQAVAYLNQNQISIRKYLALLRGTEQSKVSLLSREFHDRTRYEGSQNAVATTWLVSFTQIQRSDKTAASILGFISCIEPKAIPRSILPEVEPEEEMEHAIGTLRGYAFLSQRGDEEIFDMHSLVYMATRVWLKSEGLIEQATMDAICHIEKIFPSRDRMKREKWRAYIPHGLRVLDRSNWCQIAERFNLFMTVGSCLDLDRRFREAIRCFEAANEWRKENFSEDDESRLMSEYALASAYLDDRRIKEAIKIFEHVVAIEKRTLADEDHDRLASKHELARAYLEDRQIKEAIKIFEHVVAVRKRTLADEDHARLASEHELARAYLNDRRIKEAIEIFEHVVAVQKRTLADEDHARLVSEHELARAYLTDRRIKEAIEIFEHVVAVRKRTLADEDHDRLSSEHELARAYLEDRQIKEAIKIFEHVVAVRKRTLADEDYSRLTSEHELARAYLTDRQIKEAIEILEHVVAIQKRTLADEDYDRLISERVLAKAYLNNKMVKEAIQLLEHIVAVEKDLFEEDDPDRLVSLNLLRDAYMRLEPGSKPD
jgi:tetratricopeptide (TPR) repeat protein